jgi:hypothetical protein
VLSVGLARDENRTEVALQYEQARHYFFPTTSRTAVAT